MEIVLAGFSPAKPGEENEIAATSTRMANATSGHAPRGWRSQSRIQRDTGAITQNTIGIARIGMAIRQDSPTSERSDRAEGEKPSSSAIAAEIKPRKTEAFAKPDKTAVNGSVPGELPGLSRFLTGPTLTGNRHCLDWRTAVRHAVDMTS